MSPNSIFIFHVLSQTNINMYSMRQLIFPLGQALEFHDGWMEFMCNKIDQAIKTIHFYETILC
jgi:hypothetical protein